MKHPGKISRALEPFTTVDLTNRCRQKCLRPNTSSLTFEMASPSYRYWMLEEAFDIAMMIDDDVLVWPGRRTEPCGLWWMKKMSTKSIQSTCSTKRIIDLGRWKMRSLALRYLVVLLSLERALSS
jgi:hypothetical protein